MLRDFAISHSRRITYGHKLPPRQHRKKQLPLAATPYASSRTSLPTAASYL